MLVVCVFMRAYSIRVVCVFVCACTMRVWCGCACVCVVGGILLFCIHFSQAS